MKRFVLRLALTTMATPLASGALAVCHQRPCEADSPRAWLGVELGPSRAGGGARVVHVVRNSPAHTGGIRDGDVVQTVGSDTIARPDDVIRAVSRHGPGQKVQVRVLRDGASSSVLVTLAAAPNSDEMLRLDKLGLPAPGWKQSLAPVSGHVPKTLEAARGKVVILDFWASWCEACRMAAPRLSSWQSRFGAQGLVVIGITDDPVPDALAGASTFGIRYGVASDESYATQKAFGVRSLPTLFVIDKQGIIRDAWIGYDPNHERRAELLVQKLLAEPSDGI